MAGLGAALHNRMNFLVERQGTVAGNIANATTPGYISKDIQFEKLVAKASSGMETTNARHFTGAKTAGGGHMMTEDRTHMKHDGNSVKTDVEMLKLQEIQLNHRLVAQLYKKHAGMQTMVLTSGSGR